MKWIVLIILLIIGPYTFLRWHYRKPQDAFEPYHDIKDRANTMRLLSAGFQRITLTADRPAEPLRNIPAITTNSIPGGLPSSLASTLVEKPLLASKILTVTTPGESNTLLAYILEFTCAVSDNRQELNHVHLYLRDGEIFLIPLFDRLNGELLSRNRENLVRITVPAGTLKPGDYEVALIGEESSRSWSLVVK